MAPSPLAVVTLLGVDQGLLTENFSPTDTHVAWVSRQARGSAEESDTRRRVAGPSPRPGPFTRIESWNRGTKQVTRPRVTELPHGGASVRIKFVWLALLREAKLPRASRRNPDLRITKCMCRLSHRMFSVKLSLSWTPATPPRRTFLPRTVGPKWLLGCSALCQQESVDNRRASRVASQAGRHLLLC